VALAEEKATNTNYWYDAVKLETKIVDVACRDLEQ
jgi:hypothetical protein